jgi:PST family polysaccharide transporter
MSLARDTVRGAFWTVSARSRRARSGLIGTLVITRFVTPSDYGSHGGAVLVMSANQFSTLGLGQFLIAKPDAGRAAAFRTTAFHVLTGAVALLVLLLLGSGLGRRSTAPGCIFARAGAECTSRPRGVRSGRISFATCASAR